MHTLVLILISILFLHGTLGVAQADIEVRQQKGLLVFEGFRQWTELRYSYLDHAFTQNDQKNSTSLHAFKESYNSSLAAAIYDPHFFDTTLQVGIIFDQSRGRYDEVPTTENAATYQYNFSGSGLDRSPTPFTLLSYRDLGTIESTYAVPYTSDNSGNEVDVAIRNGMLPSRIHLARITLDNRGGGNNNSSVSNSYSYSAEHKYKDLSATTLQLRFSDQTGRSPNSADTERTSNTLTISNTLSPGEQKKYSLLTWFNLYNSRSANFPQRTVDFRETFLGSLGKALSLEVVYTLANSRSTDDTALTQESNTNRGEVTLRHKLFSSLETTLNSAVSSNKLDGGTEDRYSGNLGIRYVKQLPEASRLALNVSKNYELVDRKVYSATLRVSDELHTGVHQGDVVDLQLGDATLISVVSVTSKNPDFTYAAEVDYSINIPFGRIEIKAGSGVRIDPDGAGTDLYITYLVNKAPVIKYYNDTTSVSSDLSLLDNNLNLGVSYIESSQVLLKGVDINESLGRSRVASVYAGARYENYNARIVFRDVVNEKQAFRSIEGSGVAGWRFRSASFSITTRDRFYRYDASAIAAGYGENTVEVALSYSQNILSNMRLNLQANAVDTRSDIKDPRDSVSLRALYKVLLNKIVLTVSGQSVWSRYSTGITRDNAATVDIVRNF